jgi:hypothetical protein
MADEEKDSITLKWGTLKAWDIKTPAALKLLKKWASLGSSLSAAMQHDTPEQKELPCKMIDASNVDTIWLDWDGKEVSKQEAKDYIMNYDLEDKAA